MLEDPVVSVKVAVPQVEEKVSVEVPVTLPVKVVLIEPDVG